MTPIPPTAQPPRRQSSLNPPAASAARRRQKKKAGRAHGWARASDLGAPMAGAGGRWSKPKPRQRRRTDGTPLLIFTVLAVITAVGLAKVQAHTRVLELAEEIGTLTEERAELLDRRRRLETERSFLRHPERIRDQATSELNMQVAPPERRQEIELLAAPAGDQPHALLPGLERLEGRDREEQP